MRASYWYRTGPLQPSGPHSYTELIAFRDSGRITADTLVSCDGKQYTSVDLALGSDFLRREAPPEKLPNNSATTDPDEDEEKPPEEKSLVTTAFSAATFLTRSIAHGAMLLTMWLATFEWDIPNMQRTVARHGSNDCQLFMLKKWCFCATVVTLLVALAWLALLWLKFRKTLQGRYLEWSYSTLALISFLYPVTLILAFILGVLGDLFWGLGSIR